MFRLNHISKKCSWCGECANACPTNALNMVECLLTWDNVTCTKCESCQDVCVNEAIRCEW